MRRDTRLLGAVAEATHETHPERMLERVAAALAEVAAVEHVEMSRDRDILSCSSPDAGVWRARRSQEPRRAPGRRPPELALELPTSEPAALSVWLRAPLPGWLGAADLQRALARLLACGLRSQAVVRRVADHSRRAHRQARELERARADAPEPVARSEAMRALLARARAVAPYPTSVLVRGESGTGKELIAALVHARSRRARAPFVGLNCGALPETLAESELFGHEPGAFTGAGRRHRGVFERAHRGTLFLDEVGELSLALQVKLLRVLERGELVRVGGERPVEADARVIAATHRDLEAMVAAGRFRADLYYRLAVFPLAIPALRERVEDIPALVDVLLSELCARLGRRRPRVDAATMAWLVGQPWPGNVRELRNTLEAALIASPGRALALPGGRSLPERTPAEAGSIPSFAEASRALLRRALRASRGKIYGPGGAAELLALHPGTLQGKMKKFGISRREFVES